MIRTVIVEDESLAATRLEMLLKKIDPELDIVAKLPSVKSSVQWFEQNPAPDLIFMDIHLDDGTSFSIFERVKIDAPVIFTTAFDDYTIQAFKVNSIDYLLKPINPDELAFALEKFRKYVLSAYQVAPGASKGVENLQKAPLKSRFLVSNGPKITSIPVEDIAYFYSEDKITFLQTFNGGRYPIEYSLDKLVGMLDQGKFFKINRQLLVSMPSIESIYKVSVNRLKLTLKPAVNKDLFVSIERYSAFKDWLDA